MSALALPPLRLVDGALLVSPTQLAQMRRCFEEWGYRNVWRRQPNAPAANRDCGKAGHEALEALVKARLRGASEADARAAMETALLTAFRRLTIHESDAWRTPTVYHNALLGYLEHWGTDQFTTLGCEIPFAIKLGVVNGIDIILRGVIDRALLWDGVVFITDYKFKDSWSEAVQVQYERDPQFKLYALALSELQRDNPDLGLPTAARGAMVDCIVIREPFKRVYSEEALAKMKPRVEYKRLRYFYTQAQLDESRRHALRWVQMALQQHAEGSFVQNEGACGFAFGKKCAYHEVCSVPVEQRAMVLASDYFTDKVERELTTNNGGDGEAE